MTAAVEQSESVTLWCLMPIAEALLQAVRRRSIARQRLTDARKALQTAETEMTDAEREVRQAEDAERRENAL